MWVACYRDDAIARARRKYALLRDLDVRPADLLNLHQRSSARTWNNFATDQLSSRPIISVRSRHTPSFNLQTFDRQNTNLGWPLRLLRLFPRSWSLSVLTHRQEWDSCSGRSPFVDRCPVRSCCCLWIWERRLRTTIDAGRDRMVHRIDPGVL